MQYSIFPNYQLTDILKAHQGNTPTGQAKMDDRIKTTRQDRNRIREIVTHLEERYAVKPSGAWPRRMKGRLNMSSIEIISKIEALKEWETILEEAKAEVESLKDTIKKEMDSRGVEELEAGQYIARFTTVISNRLDTTALKRENAALYQRYLKQSTSRRFSIA